jgi:hypothetical protein
LKKETMLPMWSQWQLTQHVYVNDVAAMAELLTIGSVLQRWTRAGRRGAEVD